MLLRHTILTHSLIYEFFCFMTSFALHSLKLLLLVYSFSPTLPSSLNQFDIQYLLNYDRSGFFNMQNVKVWKYSFNVKYEKKSLAWCKGMSDSIKAYSQTAGKSNMYMYYT